MFLTCDPRQWGSIIALYTIQFSPENKLHFKITASQNIAVLALAVFQHLKVWVFSKYFPTDSKSLWKSNWLHEEESFKSYWFQSQQRAQKLNNKYYLELISNFCLISISHTCLRDSCERVFVVSVPVFKYTQTVFHSYYFLFSFADLCIQIITFLLKCFLFLCSLKAKPMF